VRRAVRANITCPVHREAHRQRLQRHVVDHLIVAALEKGRIDRAKRLVPFGGEARSERDRMLLGAADIEHPYGKALPKMSRPVPAGIAAVGAFAALLIWMLVAMSNWSTL
jgi:hypothetical protein